MSQQIASLRPQVLKLGIGGRPLGRRSKGAVVFAVGFALAALLTIAATLRTLSNAGEAGAGAQALLLASLGIAAVLAAILGHRIWRIARQPATAATGSRLHLRFVALFSLGSVVPALTAAVFLGAVLTAGVEQYFSSLFRTTIDNAAVIGRTYVDTATENLSGEVLAMAADLNRAEQGLTQQSSLYGRFLATQAERRLLDSAFVLGRQGEVLARAERTGAQSVTPPPPPAIAAADRGEVWIRFDDESNALRALYRLTAYDGAYLYVSRSLPPGMLESLRQFDASVSNYRMAEERRSRVQRLYLLAYLSTAVLVVLGAIWLGLANATRISEPIGRLAEAARKIASGDLAARVPSSAAHDEVRELADVFNQMSSRLEDQHNELLNAQVDAETRSRFIGAVLAGVSAGVIALDRDGRVIVANRSAAQLLGIADAPLLGRRLVDVAPEFADILNHPTPQGEASQHRIDTARENASAHLSVRVAADAETGGLVLTFDDMTKVIAAQRQEAWKDVARRIAHEIKNPLTPIQLSAERLRRKYASEITTDPEIFQRCTDTILRQVADIGRMVDEFASFARMPAPRMAFADMSEIGRSAVFAQRLVYSDIKVEIIGADAPIGLICDERLISQALTNLLKNACESIQARRQIQGEPKEGQVVLRLRDLDFGVQFEVIDNGLGFPAQDRHRLIEPYVTTRAKGSGLGLAIVARIVEDHGGLIELDDAPSQGAIVRFVLPKRWEAPVDAPSEPGHGVV